MINSNLMLYVRVFKKEIRYEIKTSIINRSDEAPEGAWLGYEWCMCWCYALSYKNAKWELEIYEDVINQNEIVHFGK